MHDGILTPLTFLSETTTTTTDDMLDAFAVFVHLDVANGDASPDTVRGYFSQVKEYVTWCENVGINPVTADELDLKHYRQYLVESGFKAGTIAHKLSVLRRFYQAAHERGLRPDNPAAGIKAPRNRNREGNIQYLTEEELVRLLDVIPRTNKETHMRALSIVAFLGLQACRTVEAHRASVHDLHSDGSMLVRGKYKDRTIFLRSDVEAILRAYMARRERVLHDDMGEPIFVAVGNRSGGRRLSRRSIREIVDEHLELAGIKRPGLSAHGLRHTAATLMYEATRDQRAVQNTLGHADSRTTDIYIHIVESRENNPAAAIKVTL